MSSHIKDGIGQPPVTQNKHIGSFGLGLYAPFRLLLLFHFHLVQENIMVWIKTKQQPPRLSSFA